MQSGISFNREAEDNHVLPVVQSLSNGKRRKLNAQSGKHYLSMTNLNVIEQLKPLNLKAMIASPSGWILQVGDQFQPNAFRVWRNGGNITCTSSSHQSL